MQFVQRTKSFEFLTFLSNNFSQPQTFKFNKIDFLLTHDVHFEIADRCQIKGGGWIVDRWVFDHKEARIKRGNIFSIIFWVKIDCLCLPFVYLLFLSKLHPFLRKTASIVWLNNFLRLSVVNTSLYRTWAKTSLVDLFNGHNLIFEIWGRTRLLVRQYLKWDNRNEKN